MNPRLIIAGVSAAAALAAGYVGLSQEDVADDPALSEYQHRCAQALSYFVTQIPTLQNKRYRVTFGETYRPPFVAAIYAARHMGIANSLHTKRLAVDLNLFDRGAFVTSSEGYKPLADLWLATGRHFGVTPAAGYYFKDGNHFSCQWQGVK